jgi:diacylglycerol kinase family enzyme
MAYESGYRVVDVDPSLDIREVVHATREAGLREFIVAGGDGSIHHVVQALAGTDGVLSVLPVGTVNHTARDLGLPPSWREAFEVARRGTVRQIDTGRINGIYFLNSVMIGIYPTITHYRERFRSTHSKWRAYARAVRLALRQLKHVTLVLELDGRVQTLRTELFIVSVNAYDLTTTGMVALKTTFEDGRLSIYSMSFKSRLEFIRAAAKFFRGKIAEVEGFRSMRTPQVRIDFARPKLRVSIDGEVSEMRSPLQIAAVPASLLVRVPNGE